MRRPLASSGNVDLAAIKAREETASPGPWSFSEEGEERSIDAPAPGAGMMPLLRQGTDYDDYGAFPDLAADWDFIAHARTDVPALVAEIEWLQGLLRAAYDVEAQS